MKKEFIKSEILLDDFRDSGQQNKNKNAETRVLIPRDLGMENNPLQFFERCIAFRIEQLHLCGYEQCENTARCFKKIAPHHSGQYREIKIYPADKELWCKYVFPGIIEFLNVYRNSEPGVFQISFNCRFVFPDGSVSQFLNKGTIAFKRNRKLPEMKINLFTELGNIKTDESICLTISGKSTESASKEEFVRTYYPSKNLLLTPREIEIVRYCEEGLSSKSIAEKLRLSIHTVKNHKRNSMTKTSTHTITELIHLCFRNNWL